MKVKKTDLPVMPAPETDILPAALDDMDDLQEDEEDDADVDDDEVRSAKVHLLAGKFN